jgi:hypothetical protein
MKTYEHGAARAQEIYGREFDYSGINEIGGGK